MKFNVHGIGVKINENFTEHCESKLEKFKRILSEKDSVEAKMTAIKNTVRCELTLKVDGHYYRAEETDSDMSVAFDQALDLIKRQLRKHKTRILKHHHGQSIKNIYVELEDEAVESQGIDEAVVSRHKSFPIEMMSEEEALLQMQLLGHNFFLYLNRDSGKVNVIYTKKSGAYGVLEPEY